MTDSGSYIQSLVVTNPLIEPTNRAAIQALQLPAGSRGLDAGCGIGLQAMSLAEAVGPAGHVTGLDLSPALLAHGRELVERAGLWGRISFRRGDVRELPFDDDTFDWAWSANCVGYAPLEPLPLVRELARVVKPGGSVAILAWSSERLLPGHPLLEARLGATSAGIAPFARGKQPESHFLRALGWFRDAGLENLRAQTFAGDAHAPLTEDLRSALIALFQMRWPGVESELTPEDRAAYRRLCLPESAYFILNHPDYYAFFTYSMFCGRVDKVEPARVVGRLPMCDSVRRLRELTPEQQQSAGGKGGTLARLYQAGYPVPDGFVILPAAFDGDQLTPQAWGQVRECLARMRQADGQSALAVRSSALSEDSPRASFAGEFETVLGVEASEMLREAIHTVRRSRHSERVRAYSAARGLGHVSEMAVVVQRMVQADLSGVLFTADPVTGSRDQMTGNYVHGLGDKLVSGAATPFEFSLSRPKGRYDGPQELQHFASPLFRLAKRLEKELGCPQDIEWAIAERKLYLLQSRPITTLLGFDPVTGAFNDSRTGDFLWSSVNFGEAVTEAMTPLAWSVLQFTLDDWVFLPGHSTVGNIGGRPYLNISIFASLYQAVGRSRQDLLDTMEGTLYMRLPEEMGIPLIPLSRWELISALASLVRMQIKHRLGVRSLPAYLATNPEWCRRMRERIRAEASVAGLVALWRDEIKPHVKQGVWIVLGTVDHSTGYTLRLRRDLMALAGPQDANLLVANLSEEGEPLPSLGPVLGLAQVARGEMEREVYLAQYGHRGPHEFEISVPRPVEQPDWLDRQLARFRDSPVDVEALLRQQREAFNAAWGRFVSRHPHKAKAMRRRIDESARRARWREKARSEYVRDRWLVRTFALRAGELSGLEEDVFFLTLNELLDLLSGDESAIQYIPARRDTFQRYKALPSYPPVIRGRFDPFQWAADPERRSDLFDARAALPSIAAGGGDRNVIAGSPGAAGRAEGLVRRLDSAEQGDQLHAGEILVTVQTDIAWTLLFPRAAAVVTDVGAPLSHAAIVARELGIPAVVGCGDATMRLKTGDRVRVDGGQGIVEVLYDG